MSWRSQRPLVSSPSRLWSEESEMVLDSPWRVWHYPRCQPSVVGPRHAAGGS